VGKVKLAKLTNYVDNLWIILYTEINVANISTQKTEKSKGAWIFGKV
jgi:hypothetical protein